MKLITIPAPEKGTLRPMFYVECGKQDCKNTATIEAPKNKVAKKLRYLGWGRIAGKWRCIKCIKKATDLTTK